MQIAGSDLMKVTIIGAGNIGTYLAAYISLKKDCKVCLYTSKSNFFNKELTLLEEEKNFEHHVKLHCVTSDIKEAVKNADYILITHPSFMVENTINEITTYSKKGSVIGAIPSFGSKEEYYIDDLIKKGCIFFGSQRVPSITRLIIYGKSISLKQKNASMKLGVIPQEYSEKVCSDMTALIDIPCTPFYNYLNLPELSYNTSIHPSKLYEIFSDYSDNIVYKKIPLFYEEWGDDSSAMLLQLNEDLKNIFFELKQVYDSNNNNFDSLKAYFNIQTPDQLTQKIRTSPSFNPLTETDKGHHLDSASKLFIDDLINGLCILKGFAEILSLEVKTLDKVIYWAQELLDKDYIINGHLCGEDAKNLLIPQNIAINSIDELLTIII